LIRGDEPRVIEMAFLLYIKNQFKDKDKVLLDC
jgi:hypothetical protein